MKSQLENHQILVSGYRCTRATDFGTLYAPYAKQDSSVRGRQAYFRLLGVHCLVAVFVSHVAEPMLLTIECRSIDHSLLHCRTTLAGFKLVQPGLDFSLYFLFLLLSALHIDWDVIPFGGCIFLATTG